MIRIRVVFVKGNHVVLPTEIGTKNLTALKHGTMCKMASYLCLIINTIIIQRGTPYFSL